MAALLKFLKGNYASLNSAAIAEGQILICGDTGEMFVDVAADKRVKIGDYVTVESLEALMAIDATSVPTSRLYYVEGANILARSNGTGWDQINKDTGATSIEVVGEGNAVTAASYDVTTRKLTLTKGETFATKAELDTLDTFVGDIPEGYTETNVIAYINKKAEETLNAASGGSSESAASVLAALNTYKTENDPKVQANTEAIEALQEANAEGGTVSNAIIAAQDAADQAQKEVDELETVVSEYKTANDAAVAKKADADNVYTKSEIDGKVSALENADLAINNKIGTVAEGETVVGLIEAAQAKADAAYVKPVDGIGSNDLHADVVASLAKADSALQAADVENKADKATTLEGYGITDAYTKDEVDTAVDAKVAQSDYDTKMGELDAEDERIAGLVSTEATAREDADTALDERLVKVEAFFEGAAEDGEGLQNALDTLVEIQDYIDTHGEAASTMVDNIAANAKAIEDEAKRAGEAEEALGGRIDELSGVVETKAAAADLTALGERVTAAEGKITTLEGEMDAVEGRATTLEGKVADLEAASATHATKDELQAVSDVADAAVTVEEMNAAISAAGHASQADLTAHIDDAVKHITADERAAWNAAEQNAKDHSDANLATAKAYADQAELDAIAAAKSETESQVAAEAAIARAAEQANAKAVSDEVTAREQAVSGVQTALDTYKTSNDTAVAGKADKATTLAGYGIADAMTADQINALFTWGSF